MYMTSSPSYKCVYILNHDYIIGSIRHGRKRGIEGSCLAHSSKRMIARSPIFMLISFGGGGVVG